MQYKIPREVQVEDRIFGPITMRRLIILSVGGGFTYLIFIKLAKAVSVAIWFPPVFILGSLTLCFAFVEPLGMRFGKFLLRLFEYHVSPKKLKWDKRFTSQVYMSYITSQAKAYELKQKNKPAPQTNIQQEKELKLQKLKEISPLLDNLKPIDLSQNKL